MIHREMLKMALSEKQCKQQGDNLIYRSRSETDKIKFLKIGLRLIFKTTVFIGLNRLNNSEYSFHGQK
jgi:hypothetical protein